MDRTMILTIGGFLAAAVVFILVARWQGQRDRAARQEYARKHGWEMPSGTPDEVREALALFAPAEIRVVGGLTVVEGPPRSLYLFSFNWRTRGSRSDLTGTACLARHDGPRAETPISISRRVPLVEKMTPDRLDVGSSDFRAMWIVTGEQPGVAAELVNDAVQRAFLEHDRGPAWTLEVDFVGPWVFAGSHWAAGPEEWDHLVDMTRKLAEGAGR
ncbi:MAG: hypothetical protein MUF27_04430 [Acidobacteria bacterium]|nr:hypothetical protein [Acidobacteriota bacterium]